MNRLVALFLPACLSVTALLTGTWAAVDPRALYPAFLWSREPVFSASAAPSTSRISHEVKQYSFLSDLVNVLVGKASSSNEFVDPQGPDFSAPKDGIILLIGQSDQAGNVLGAHRAGETAPLRRAMASAASSLAVPFLQTEGQDLVSSWQAELQREGVASTPVGPCSRGTGGAGTGPLTPDAATHGIQTALSTGFQVVLVCSGSEASLEQEMELLEAATAAAGSSSVVFGFIAQPSQGAKQVGRSLLEAVPSSGSLLRMPTDEDLAALAASRDATVAAAQDLARSQLDTQLGGLASDPQLTPAGFKPAPGGLRPSSLPARPGNQGGDDPFQGLVCDDKCQVQVTMIEVAILGFTVISALVSGTWLLHGVGTPTRFETSKESGQHGQ